jgi:hypothetical protein
MSDITDYCVRCKETTPTRLIKVAGGIRVACGVCLATKDFLYDEDDESAEGDIANSKQEQTR